MAQALSADREAGGTLPPGTLQVTSTLGESIQVQLGPTLLMTWGRSWGTVSENIECGVSGAAGSLPVLRCRSSPIAYCCITGAVKAPGGTALFAIGVPIRFFAFFFFLAPRRVCGF